MKGWADANFTNYHELNRDGFIRDNSRNSRQSFLSVSIRVDPWLKIKNP